MCVMCVCMCVYGNIIILRVGILLNIICSRCTGSLYNHWLCMYEYIYIYICIMNDE